MRQAVLLLDHAVRSRLPDYAHAFQPLLRPLDEYALHILEKQIRPRIPPRHQEAYEFFNPGLDHLSQRERILLGKNQRYLRANLVYGRSIQRLDTLLFCLDYARQGGWGVEGVWSEVVDRFSSPEFGTLYQCLSKVNQFRNTRVAHVEQPLTDAQEAWEAMRIWLAYLYRMAALAA